MNQLEKLKMQLVKVTAARDVAFDQWDVAREKAYDAQDHAVVLGDTLDARSLALSTANSNYNIIANAIDDINDQNWD